MNSIIDNIISIYNQCYEQVSSLQIYPCNIVKNINSNQCEDYCNLPRKERIDMILSFNDIKNYNDYYNLCNRGDDISHVISAKTLTLQNKKKLEENIVALKLLVCASLIDKIYGQTNDKNNHFKNLVDTLTSLKTFQYHKHLQSIKTLEVFLNLDQRIEHVSSKDYSNDSFGWYLYRVRLLYSRCFDNDSHEEKDVNFLSLFIRPGEQNY